MKNTTVIAILTMLALLVGACDRPSDKIDIARVDQAVAQFSQLTPSQQAETYDSLRADIDAFFTVMGTPDPTLQDIDEWGRGTVVTMFQPQVDRVYPNLDKLECQLGALIDRAQRDTLTLPPMRFATVVWGKPQPIMRVDTVMLIALNHYLGADFDGYSHIEAYRRFDKEPWAIPYDVAATLAATQYPFRMSETPTLLNWMLYEGALVEARMRLVPDALLTHALGYRPDQLELLNDNFRKIWEELTLRKMFYDTDPAVIDRMLTSAPNTPLLDGQAPGRVGRYIGYMIVTSYLRKHPATTLDQLLSPSFYANSKTLIDSGI